jgi:hypothetical protein
MLVTVTVSETEFYPIGTWLIAHGDITAEHIDLTALSFVIRCTEIN